MPHGDRFMSGLFPRNASKTVVRNGVLTRLEALSLQKGLAADAADMYYSGWISLLDALNGIDKGFYTWATIKLYYSVFYAFRASLAQNGLCAFHVDKSPYTVIAQAGQSPVSSSERGTHKTILKAFERRNAAHALVSQQINLEDPINWLIQRREHANYGEARFSEPEWREPLNFVATNGLRSAINAYVSEPTFLYVFDPDHAMLAYPLRALQMIGSNLMPNVAQSLSEEEQEFLKARSRDRSGAFSTLIAEMRRLSVLA